MNLSMLLSITFCVTTAHFSRAQEDSVTIQDLPISRARIILKDRAHLTIRCSHLNLKRTEVQFMFPEADLYMLIDVRSKDATLLTEAVQFIATHFL